jgi:hypothetical protein
MANFAFESITIEVTTKEFGEISGPLCSVVAADLDDGLQPIGQKGLRPLSSIMKADFVFSSIVGGDGRVPSGSAGASAATARESAAQLIKMVQENFFIAS